jgi:glycosyltransferase involved in cell wall biosynthesis
MSTIAVSIVVPTYNRSKLLKECVDSLLAQTCSDLEIIIVDDGSTDDTQETIKTVTDKQDRVKYYPRPHLGACAARNFGLDQSTGEFIGFFDSDDLWPPDYIETMVRTLRARPDYGAAYSRLMLLCDGEIRGQHGRATKFPSGYLTIYLFSNTPYVLPSAVIFRRDAWNGVRWDEALKTNNEDLEVYLRISTRTKFIYVPDVYALYRQTSDSITTAAAKKMIPYKARVMERFYFQSGGKSYVPRRWAFRQISHLCRSFGLKHYRAGNRTASIALLKMALSYLPLDLRLYVNLFRAFLLNPGDDKMPDWQMFPALPAGPDENTCLSKSRNEYSNAARP